RPLSRRAGMSLALEALPGVGEDVAMRLFERSGGNPFYLEELIRHAASGHVDELPESVLAMIGARLAALPADERRLLRAASVSGAAFWVGGLAALLGESRVRVIACLDRLAERELVTRQRH